MIQSKLMESIPNSTTFDIELDYEGEKRLAMFLMRPKKKNWYDEHHRNIYYESENYSINEWSQQTLQSLSERIEILY